MFNIKPEIFAYILIGVSDMLMTDVKRYKAETWDIMQFMFEKFNDHQLHCVIELDSHIDENCLKKAVYMSTWEFPLVICKFVEKKSSPYWQSCKFTTDDIVRIIETEKVHEEIEKCIVLKTDTFKGPQLRINIIRSSTRDCLCIIINHMLCDAAGFKDYLYMLSSIYSNLKDNPGYTPNFQMSSRSAKQVLDNFSDLDKVKIFFSSSQVSKYNGGIYFPLEGDNNNPFVVIHKITKDRVRFIKKYAKESKTTINDIVIASYIRALQKELHCSHIALPCPVDLRRYIPEKKAQGICNLTSNMVCDIGKDIGENYKETLLKVKKSMEHEKKSFSCLNGPMMLEIIFSLLPYKFAKSLVCKLFHNPPIAMTNIGIIDKEKLSFYGAGVKDAYMNGSIKYNPYFQVALTTFDDEFTFSVNFCGTQKDRQKIQSFLQTLDDELPKLI